MSRAASPLAVEPREDGVGFWIQVTPRARREGIRGVHGDALRVDVKAPPVEGKANAACVRVLAEALDLPRAAIHIAPGARARRKRVRVSGDPEQIGARLHALATDPGLR